MGRHDWRKREDKLECKSLVHVTFLTSEAIPKTKQGQNLTGGGRAGAGTAVTQESDGTEEDE